MGSPTKEVSSAEKGKEDKKGGSEERVLLNHRSPSGYMSKLYSTFPPRFYPIGVTKSSICTHAS